jgi:hypothetical protein
LFGDFDGGGTFVLPYEIRDRLYPFGDKNCLKKEYDNPYQQSTSKKYYNYYKAHCPTGSDVVFIE